MAVFHGLRQISGTAWTELTGDVVSAITFQNRGDAIIQIGVTSSTSAPSAVDSGLFYGKHQGEVNVALASLAPGVTGGNRVWARCRVPNANAEVWVSHA